MNVYIQEFKANFKTLLIWSLGIIFLILMGIIEFKSVESGTSFNDLIEVLPSSLKALMGLGDFDYDTAIGYYSVLYQYITLIVAIHAVMLGVGIINKEERDSTVDFLLTKPVTRNKIITAKVIAGFTNILIINIITLISSILMFGIVSEDNIALDIISLMIGMFFLQILFFSIGLVFSAMKNNSKFSTGVPTGILLSTFFLSIVENLNEKLSFLKYITPFKYFTAEDLLLGSGFNIFLIILVLVITSSLVYLTYIFYNKRDLGR